MAAGPMWWRQQGKDDIANSIENLQASMNLDRAILADVERLAAAAMEPCCPEPCAHCEKLACAIDEHEDWCLMKYENKCKTHRLRAALRTVCAIMEE